MTVMLIHRPSWRPFLFYGYQSGKGFIIDLIGGVGGRILRVVTSRRRLYDDRLRRKLGGLDVSVCVD